MIGVKDGDKEEDLVQPLWLELLCDMIKETNKQPEGVELSKERPEE